MPVDHSEANFEGTIEAILVGDHGYRSRSADTDYDRAACLDPELLLQFIITTQPQTWERLKQQHGDEIKTRFLKRLVKEIESRGTLDVLRKGVIDLGCKFDLAYFQPETGHNEEHRRLYRANIFSVVRQLHYSQQNENSIDLVLFLNGVPILTSGPSSMGSSTATNTRNPTFSSSSAKPSPITSASTRSWPTS